MTEKIIAAHCNRRSVAPGDEVFVRPDLAVGSEIIFPQVLKFLKELGGIDRHRADNIALINGHLVATREAAVGTLVDALDRFAASETVKNYYQIGRAGACQNLLADQGLISPGQFVIGSDQHITTYGALGAFATGVGGLDLAAVWATGVMWLRVPASGKITLEGGFNSWVTAKDLALHLLWKLGIEGAVNLAVEFHGSALEHLTMDDRFAIANMMVETGAVTAWFPCDGVTLKFLQGRGKMSTSAAVMPDSGTEYALNMTVDLAEVEPMVAAPYSPINGIPITKVNKTEVHQVVIGTCTNGSIADYRLIAPIFERHDTAEGMKLMLFPASHQTIREMLDEGLGLLFTEKGAQISPPTCQACLGSGPSLIGKEEVGVYTTNRNYRGRHGPPTAQIFLAGAPVAAAAAVTGELTDPRELMK